MNRTDPNTIIEHPCVIARQGSSNIATSTHRSNLFSERWQDCFGGHFIHSRYLSSRNDEKLVKSFRLSPLTSHRFAFTLSEVLITLGIIGVVGAMTIPNLVSNYQKDQTVTQLKKAYSEISQVFASSTAENGFPSTWDLGTTYDNTNNIKVMETYIVPYFAVAQNCALNKTGSCTRKTKHYMNGSDFSFGGYQIMLKDGTVLDMRLDGNYVDPPYHIDISIDLNGEKKPNIMGKDIFFLAFNKNYNKAVFYGDGKARSYLLSGSSGSWGCNKTDTWMAGAYCGALIQKDGWKISDDYPWN